ncbi:glucose-6-phosphate dehydrogenase [Pseudonocardia alaniniphila]|uniref:Glucose-6-phosphate dehydrogenase n=1 Tax=Pseudonocardia alaniniphila TaxID=75291 RepID=A0ABS9TU18_9PSEU|nr:glucose-6-phosphate dehydrogenase [Pseudonocardia alaniniphila]MCH6172062.1 glucose-6-phosphate dehydrogenase [Pseudonocardia alaniniphila]
MGLSTLVGAAEPAVLVIHGATGDVAKRWVLPALASLAHQGLLPSRWRLVGCGRGRMSDGRFRDIAEEALREFGPPGDPARTASLLDGLRFAGGGFTVADPGELPAAVRAARADIGGDPIVVHYLGIPPAAFAETARAIAAHGLADGARVVFEKPYGTSPETFEALDGLVRATFDECQVFRIDHFLAKAPIRVLTGIRAASRVIGHLWSREHVEQVQIEVCETLDVAVRAGFYDATGAVLDMLATHLMQVLAEVVLEPPDDMAGLQKAREAALAAIRPIDPADVVLGQAAGYRDLPDVPADSTTETYAAARLWVDTDRWRGVPFVLRTGKQLAEAQQNVTLVLKEPDGKGWSNRPPETVTLALLGDGQVWLDVRVGQRSDVDAAAATRLAFDVPRATGAPPLPAYAWLMLDVLRGDQDAFPSSEALRQAWRVVDPLLRARPPVQSYVPRSWGPAEANRLAAPLRWRGSE